MTTGEMIGVGAVGMIGVILVVTAVIVIGITVALMVEEMIKGVLLTLNRMMTSPSRRNEDDT